ncbi:hypothetical protein PV783_14045 [Chitinophaga sp. CC14]|uniref:hypothetical protein n=1 Tax=Chitinophaga sp. CC14 TaxID=3029199 RepID=UPI003B7E2C9E
MEISLKNIVEYKKMSEETVAYSASLYIQGKKAGQVSNNGHGGMTTIRADNETGAKLIEQASNFVKSQPPDITKDGENTYKIAWTMDSYVDDIAIKFFDDRDLKKLLKITDHGIVFKIEEGTYQVIEFTQPLDNLLSTPEGKALVTRSLTKAVNELGAGVDLLNKNIPAQLLPPALRREVSRKSQPKQKEKQVEEKKIKRKR